MIFLLFNVGLETKPQAILAVGRRAFIVAVLGVVVPFAAGYLIALWWDGLIVEAMFIGAALVATSVGITARVLGSLGLLDAPTARIILGAAVIDDILGLLILSVVSGFSKGAVDYYELAKTAGLAIFFTLFVVFIGADLVIKTRAANRKSARLETVFQRRFDFVFGTFACRQLHRRCGDNRRVSGGNDAGGSDRRQSQNAQNDERRDGISRAVLSRQYRDAIEFKYFQKYIGDCLGSDYNRRRRADEIRRLRTRSLRAWLATRGAGRDWNGAARRSRHRRRANRIGFSGYQRCVFRRRIVYGDCDDFDRSAVYQNTFCNGRCRTQEN